LTVPAGPREAPPASAVTCPFCGHASAALDKFCSECGGALHLVPCMQCGAVNDVAANSCYQCRSPLRGRGADVPSDRETAPVLEVPGHRHALAMGVAATLLAAIVLGYFAHRGMSIKRAAVPPAASKAMPPPAPAPVAAPAASPAWEAQHSSPPPTESRRAQAVKASKAAGRARPADPPAARATSAPLIKSRPDPAPREAQGCPEEVAALDLCRPDPGKLEPIVGSGIDSSAVAPRPAQSTACAAGVAALDLCPPDSQQRRN